MKKVKYVKSLFIASLVVSFLSVVFGIYLLINSEYLISVVFLSGGAMGLDVWKTFLTKNK